MTTVSENEKGFVVTFNDGKEITLKKPDRSVLSQALAAGGRDPLGAADVLVNRCLVDGDKSILKVTGYCHQLVSVLDELFGKVNCLLEWKDDPAFEHGVKASLEFQDGKKCLLQIPTRQQYASARAAARVSPLRFAEDLLKACWIGGDEKIKNSAGYLLGFSEVAEELLSYTGRALGN